MKFTTQLVLAIGYLSSQVAANSGYASTCNSINWEDPSSNSPYWLVIANCREPSGIYNVDTVLNLGLCIANGNGVLYAQAYGGFDGSCKNIHMSGTVLTATCPDSAGNEHNPSIDTNNFIGNQNGIMSCFGLTGL